MRVVCEAIRVRRCHGAASRALSRPSPAFGHFPCSQGSCKKALDQTNASEVEIDIDTLDLQTFLKVEKYVQECLARQKKKSK